MAVKLINTIRKKKCTTLRNTKKEKGLMNRKKLTPKQKETNRVQRKVAAKNNCDQIPLSRPLRDRIERKLLLIEHFHLERHFADRHRKQRIDAKITELIGEIHKVIKTPKPILVKKTPPKLSPIQNKQKTNINEQPTGENRFGASVVKQ